MNDSAKQHRDGLNLVVALPAEAKPIIDLLNLKRDQVNRAMPVYSHDNIRLVISGAGANSSANAVRYLHATQPDTVARWYNIGICGHGSHGVGVALLIDHIIDRQSGRHWSLKMPHRISCPVGTLTCVTEPQTDYAYGMAYDMESSGFIDAVNGINSNETARVFKIVSDNPANDARRINGKLVSSLIEQHSAFIRSMIE